MDVPLVVGLLPCLGTESWLDVDYAEAGVISRTASESINLEIPLKIKLIPTKVPITQTELDGHRAQIKIPRIRVTIPSATIVVRLRM